MEEGEYPKQNHELVSKEELDRGFGLAPMTSILEDI